MQQEASPETKPALDAFTVGAIAILAYILGNILHEGLGPDGRGRIGAWALDGAR